MQIWTVLCDREEVSVEMEVEKSGAELVSRYYSENRVDYISFSGQVLFIQSQDRIYLDIETKIPIPIFANGCQMW